MTTQEIATMVASIGIPYSYYQFPEGTAEPCPFLCFYLGDSDDFLADNTNYVRIENLTIELYTDFTDFALERQIEERLNANELVFSKTRTWIDTEKMTMVTYESEVILNG